MAEVGHQLVGCDGPLPISGDSSTVVIEGQESQLPKVVEGGGHIGMGEDAGLLQVTVGEISPQVVIGDDVCLNIRKERSSPEGRRVSQSEENAPHPWLGSVHRADHGGIVQYHLRELGQM